MPAVHRCVPALRLLALLAALLATAPAQALRCNGRLVDTGDHAVQVERRCGEPYWIETYSEWLVVGENRALERRIERQLEAWYYNFGPDRLLHRLLFVDGRLVRDDTLGYGVSEIGARCNYDSLDRGLSIGEVVARCGLPASQNRRYGLVTLRDDSGLAREREARRDEWIYDPGSGRRLQLIVFVDGRVSERELLDR
jgi:Protein of unknown function (DUF2845)